MNKKLVKEENLSQYLHSVGSFATFLKTRADNVLVGQAMTKETLKTLISQLHRDESGVAMTEYIIIFSLMSFGATLSLLGVAAYVKGYRDFLVWWLAHPAV